MIKSFKNAETAAVAKGLVAKKLPIEIQKVALRKIRQLEAAQSLNDLKAPPSNKLEKLKHDRTGQHSIRINGQWRLCFSWRDGDAYDVEITDYH